MFKYVAAAALTGVITAVDLQDNTQELVELEDLDNDFEDIALEEQESIELPTSKTNIKDDACNELKKTWKVAKTKL